MEPLAIALGGNRGEWPADSSVHSWVWQKQKRSVTKISIYKSRAQRARLFSCHIFPLSYLVTDLDTTFSTTLAKSDERSWVAKFFFQFGSLILISGSTPLPSTG